MASEKGKPKKSKPKKPGFFSRLKKSINRRQDKLGEKRRASFFTTREGSTKADPMQLASARKYKIKSGDTLSQIARNYGVSLKALKEANKIKDANKIRAGQNLIVPGGMKPKAANVYEGTDMSKITKNQTKEQIAAQRKKNKKIDEATKDRSLERQGRTKGGVRKNALFRKKGGSVKKMSSGGMTARGMGAATRGGNYRIR